MNAFRLVSTLLLAATASAQPIQILEPPVPAPIRGRPQVTAESLQVKTRIVDGVATTTLRQTLKNAGSGQAEATWILPLPDGAIADGFQMTMGGKDVGGEVLNADQARQVYEQIVRRMRDPGLLEYYGSACIRARVFPIPPRGTMDVEVRFRQVLPKTGSLQRWRFPLRAAGIVGQPVAKVSLDLQVESRQPLKTVYSPLAEAEVIRKGDHEARVTLELAGVQPERDLEVYLGTSEKAFGLDLLTWRKKGQPGHFLMMVTPRQDWPAPENQMRVVQFVIDTSGSMQGQKIEQARGALRFFVDSLATSDLFNVVPFATEARPFFPGPVPASKENVAKAHELIDMLEARGGTNIDDALGHALTHALPKPMHESTPKRLVPITVFLTDGQPTVGETKIERLAANVKSRNESESRVFVFGVGNDVNTKLLDRIAEDGRGDRDYVRENENIEVKTSALFTKLSHPVLTGVSLSFDDLTVTSTDPVKPRDLFRGSRLVMVGRYSGSGHKAIRLKGTVDGVVREYVYEADFPESSSEHDFVPVLWAQRRVATLLDAIRINGASQELVSEVQRLGKEFGIVTPYTSHLIVEEGMQIARHRGVEAQFGSTAWNFAPGDAGVIRRVRQDLIRAGGSPIAETTEFARQATVAQRENLAGRARLKALPTAAASGEDAVDRSVNMFSLRNVESASRMQAGHTAMPLQQQNAGRSFHLVQGVWVDRQYRESMRGSERRVAAYSDEYFRLLRENPELRRVFSMSERLVVVINGEAVEVTI